MSNGERRLAAIMFTDIVGYTALTQQNESETMRLLEEHRRLIRPLFASHGGREIKTIGDAFLVEFSNALDATLCAIAVQSALNDRKLSKGDELSLRIGIHVGDVIQKEKDVLGDAVNIASRIEPLADPGGICVSREVYSQVKNKLPYPLSQPTSASLKNVREQVEVYKVILPWGQQPKEETALPRDRIAILPFANMSPDPNDEYFADGMTEEIISTVSGISGLNVISRTSVMHYKKTEKTLKEIGRELEVGSVLEGSFRKAGNRIRVTTQLIDVAADRHLWAQNYDRNLDDVFAVQSDIAKQVAEALKIRILSPEKERIEKKPTESTTAYALYLKGRYYWAKRELEDVRRAIHYFELSVHEDPGFALGYVGEADCCLALRDNWGIDREANLLKEKSMVAKALELDLQLAEARASNASILAAEYDLGHAEEEYKKAIELKPSYATAHHWYQLEILRPQQRWDEALKEIERAIELDPLSPILVANLGGYYLNRREYAKAVEPFRKAAELGLSFAHGHLALTYGELGRFDEMRREYAIDVKLAQPSFPLARTVADVKIAYYEGDDSTVKRLLPVLESGLEDAGLGAYSHLYGFNAQWIAELHFHLGDIDKGFEWLERSYRRRERSLWLVTVDRDLDGVRSDPRYLDLVKRLGLD